MKYSRPARDALPMATRASRHAKKPKPIDTRVLARAACDLRAVLADLCPFVLLDAEPCYELIRAHRQLKQARDNLTGARLRLEERRCSCGDPKRHTAKARTRRRSKRVP